ncbi:unnamed protein product [Albugo candida]|uniref:Uncharacterized protein n=1 Tax=Albugo candida TaxID=65357 RepID=A0A024G663_9STRA|nr:unnamed protein product [Albugo candida]|eukprot:CCI42158.1 unnamed protein product [Albugo candida]
MLSNISKLQHRKTWFGLSSSEKEMTRGRMHSKHWHIVSRNMNMSKRFALISNSILSIHRDRLYPAAINFYNCDKYFRVQSWEVNRKKHTSKRKKMSDIE